MGRRCRVWAVANGERVAVDSITRGLVVALVVLGLVALSGPFMMGGMMGPGMMGTPMGDAGWQSVMVWGLGGLTMLAFWGLLIVGAVLLIRLLDRRQAPPPAPRSESALEIAGRRYAAGELTRAQFEQMREDLRRD